MSVSINEYHPTTMTHPGAFLSDKLEEMGKKPEEFAQEIGAFGCVDSKCMTSALPVRPKK